jgi:hypothetical protein
VPAATYEFTGQNTLGYPDFRDTATGKMLVAEPGGSYGIAAIDGGGVPPGDGRWTEASVSSGPPPGPPPSPPPVPPVPALAEGSEAA